MFLFRPSNNNQRYAFVPLLDPSDNDDDEFDDDEEKGDKIIIIDNFQAFLTLPSQKVSPSEFRRTRE